MSAAGTCRQCGCTDTDPCLVLGGTYSWVEPDLCSACENKELTLRQADVVALRDAPQVVFQMDSIQAFLLLGALHLVMRHPELGGMPWQVVYDLAQALEERLALTPRLAEIAAAGRDPKRDVPAAAPRRIWVPGDQ